MAEGTSAITGSRVSSQRPSLKHVLVMLPIAVRPGHQEAGEDHQAARRVDVDDECIVVTEAIPAGGIQLARAAAGRQGSDTHDEGH
jgi:hypothetical protein